MLTPAHRNRVRELFAEGIQTSPADRPGWLKHQCAGLPSEVRDQLADLLAANDEAGDFLRDPTVDPAALVAGFIFDGPGSELVPRQIGPYTLRRVLGRGGFGIVFLAEQFEPIKREVALKLITPGKDTRQVIARFEAERQALARMGHPNIAQIIEAGATDAGRPYVVMEWVDGPSIVAYAEQHRLPFARRLALFADVCDAIQHAHQKGIVHRDIKPSNVLVATNANGDPVPKVIDFGVAKAVGESAEGWVALTADHQFVGTPQYMSPEQADPTAGPPDTRTDVCGLGLLLYELLTGRPPFDAEVLRKADPAELPKIVRERVPDLPSRQALAAATDPADGRRRARALRGDLDWIVARATATEPERRYPTAAALAEDVGRHLAGEPVLAGAPSRAYRARKFVARHRKAVAAAATFSVVTLGGGTASTALWFDAADSRDRALHATVAESAQRLAAEQQRAVAVARKAEAEAHARRVQDAQNALFLFLFKPANVGKPPPVELLDYLKRELAAGGLAGRPESEAPFRQGLATAYEQTHGRLADARDQYVATLAALDGIGPSASPYAYASCYFNLGDVLRRLGELGPSAKAFEASLPLYERLAAKQKEPTLAGTTRVWYVLTLLEARRFKDAALQLTKALDEADRVARFTPDDTTLCQRVAGAAERLDELAGDRLDGRAIADRARALIAKHASDAVPNRSDPLVYPAASRPATK